MEYIEMNDFERKELKAKVKNSIQSMFDWFKEGSYFDSVGISAKKRIIQLEEIEVDELVSYVLDARLESIKVKCNFNNEFFEGDNRSGKFFVWGDATIDENLENIISMEPSLHFTYESEFDDSDYPEDYSRYLISHTNISDVNMYSGSFSYTGIVSEESEYGRAPLECMELFNEVQIRYIEDNEPAWKKHIAASYRLYNGKSYKLAFLMAFIGLDSLIELINETIKNVYFLHVNENIDFEFKNYNKSFWTAIKLMREDILVSESYMRLEKLENPNRKLVKEKLVTIFKFANDWTNAECQRYVGEILFFEVIRNSLAHGNDYNKDYIQGQSYFGLYKDEVTNDIDFNKLYVGLIMDICQLIEDLRREELTVK